MPSYVDISKIKIVRLSPKHNADTSRFSCGKEPLDTFIQKEALKYQDEGVGVTHLFYYEDKLIGFVTLSMADVRKRKVPEEKLPTTSVKSYPALMIGRLAVTKDMWGQDIGSFICEWVRNKALESIEWVGCHFLVVNSKPDVVTFYEKCGFVTIKKQESSEYITMIRLLVDKPAANQ